MALFALTLLIFLGAFAALAIGVMGGRAPIQGSCGGLACSKHGDCSACPKRQDWQPPEAEA